MDFSRAQLRKLDALAAVHDFMKRENEGGGITRQEAVSMIPPLFLDVQPHHLVPPPPHLAAAAPPPPRRSPPPVWIIAACCHFLGVSGPHRLGDSQKTATCNRT